LSPSVSKFAPNDNDENNNSNNKAKMAPTRWNQEATQDLLVSIFVVMRSGMKPDVQASIVEEMKSRGHDDISWEPLRYGRALFCIFLSCHRHVRLPLFLSCLQVLGGEYSEKSRFVGSLVPVGGEARRIVSLFMPLQLLPLFATSPKPSAHFFSSRTSRQFQHQHHDQDQAWHSGWISAMISLRRWFKSTRL
jgi:hypothetical protein